MNQKLILAPMATLSHEAFRRCVAKFGGCDEYFNEMINAGSLIHQGPFEKYYLTSGSESEKMVWQLTGSRSDYMKTAAQILAELPGLGVDINMGCSAPQIACTGAGIAWMTKPIAETQAMVKEVKSALENSSKDGKTPPRLSVKLRLGGEGFTEKGFFDFTDMLISEGVQSLTLHPRTQKEKLARSLPRYEYVEKLALRYPNIPVNLNGEVKDKNSLEFALKKAPHAAGVMIGREAAKRPWIFAKLKGELPTEKVDMQQLALDFIDDIEKFQPKEFFKTRLQRFFYYFCQNFDFANYFKVQMLNSENNEDARKRIKEYFKKQSEERFKTL
ncbi:tRNA-dihydrouridine synthase family protein [Treponema pectinovorum]|uniref:tRNA-dihydrouridine synthase family protein n=1 Tax=Treponema pectinovorum TaxID=164 RepID=UPI003D915B14